ncbi:MAG: hypothetical protein IJP88_05465 [Synergistaceae bacterium]|nr:hypothetical protein [Synergistaceae bacterium]MBR0096607.1 hypothetical protein [Synergistaceae bacterium]
MSIINIWVNRILAGDKTFDDVPKKRKAKVEEELKARLSEEEFNRIIGTEVSE